MNLLYLFLIFSYALTQNANAQSLRPAICDSTIMSRDEFEKCKLDTIYNAEIIARINYISILKTELLPKYRLKRNAFHLPPSLKDDLKRLKKLYDSTVIVKLVTFSREMDENQMYVQPKAYLSSIIQFEVFRIYPDVYAVLLNPIHLHLNPKTTQPQHEQFYNFVLQVYNSVVKWNNPLALEFTENLNKEKRKFSEHFDLFPGAISDEERQAYDIVNFLLWTE